MLLMVATLAQASSTYPVELQTLSDGPCEPLCTVCHESNAGGSGTVVQPFGEAMMARGLTGGSDVDALDAAFMALLDDEVDSDGDGTIDVDELTRGKDPNGGEPFCGVRTPTFGCLSHSPTLPGLALLVLAALRVRGGRRD